MTCSYCPPHAERCTYCNNVRPTHTDPDRTECACDECVSWRRREYGDINPKQWAKLFNTPPMPPLQNLARWAPVVHQSQEQFREIERRRDPVPEPVSIHDLVAEDLEERKEKGLETYGVVLHAHNGRSALWDAYEEALDLACYLRQKIEEERTSGHD